MLILYIALGSFLIGGGFVLATSSMSKGRRIL